MLFEPYVRFHIFTFGKPSGRLLGAAHSAYDMYSKYLIRVGFSF